ncbi:hypothetical protein ABZW96_35180 [Nocardia sp. NPDC004168]|uniref:hypothetical protein n=1 Tax=Nocardia TaxID=1817 RepID=UPI0033BBB0FD
MEHPIMAATDPPDPMLTATETGAGISSDAAIVWPDPSPLDAWWRRIMHSDPVRRSAA